LDFRIGSGFDAHKFVPNRPLILGGVNIPHEKGLLGHSDADALSHAISDAILGAAALGDMGQYFPDTDLKWKDADSHDLLSECVHMVKAKGWVIGNVDATLICQKPKLAPFINSMIRKLSETLEVEESCVSVKAKTTEGMGYEGREEGLSAQVVVLLKNVSSEK